MISFQENDHMTIAWNMPLRFFNKKYIDSFMATHVPASQQSLKGEVAQWGGCIREYRWYTSTVRRIVTNVLVSLVASLYFLTGSKNSTIATLSLSLRNLRPILRYIPYIPPYQKALPTHLIENHTALWGATSVDNNPGQSDDMMNPSDPDFVPSTNPSCLSCWEQFGGWFRLMGDIVGPVFLIFLLKSSW